jgi:hypothetical protein
VAAFGAAILLSMITSLAGTAGAQNTPQGQAPKSTQPAPASTSQVLAAVAAATSTKALPQNVTPPLSAAQEDEGSYIASEKGCNPAPNQTTLPACIYGDPSGKKTIVLFGDSHAAMWLGAFDDMAKAMHWKLVLLFKAACPAIDSTIWNYSTSSPFLSCTQFHSNMVKRINQMDPAVVAITNWWNGDGIAKDKDFTVSQWGTALTAMVNSIKSPGTQKVLLGDIPYLAQSAPSCLAAHSSNIQACSTPATTAVLSTHESELAAVAKSTGALYVPVTQWFCSKSCTAVVANNVVYGDGAHITSVYAEYLWGALMTALQPVLGANPASTTGN